MRQLGQLEALVMERVWSWNRPTLVREVLQELQRDREIAYTTVMTVMDNLFRKGFLTRTKEGRAYRYEPTQSKEQYAAGLMEDVLATSANRTATLLHFVEGISPEDLAGLREVLGDTKRVEPKKQASTRRSRPEAKR